MQMKPATSEKLTPLNWISIGTAIIFTRQPRLFSSREYLPETPETQFAQQPY